MSRISELRNLIRFYGTEVTTHYTDGPQSGYWNWQRKGYTENKWGPTPGHENRVMVTLDLADKLEKDVEEKMRIHLFFLKNVDRVYFTKKRHRLKIIFNSRSKRGLTV